MAKDMSELIRDLTKRFVHYIDVPKASRRTNATKEPWYYRWFGMMPVTLKIWLKRWNERLRRLR